MGSSKDSSSKGRKHWFRFYFERFLLGTSHMNDREVGAYVRALLYQFDKGGLPDDHKSLQIPKVKEKFHLVPIPPSVNGEVTVRSWWINDVMDAERRSSLEEAEKLSKSGHKGGIASSLAKAVVKQSSTNKIREDKISTVVDEQPIIVPVLNSTNNISLIKPFDTENNRNSLWASQAWGDQRWKEVVCMKDSALISPQTFEMRLRAFLMQLEIDKKIHVSVSEFMRHFPNWLRKQSPIEAESSTGMRGYDYEAIIEERVRPEDLAWARANRSKALKLRETGINDFVV